MPDDGDLLQAGNGAIVAPAGHGKTEAIATLAARGQRALVLTHTHAGVNAIRVRLKRLGVPNSRVAVDTIAGWCMRYAHAFPQVAQPPTGMPQGAQWDQLHRGATRALAIDAIQAVVKASYDRVFVDEYQDCNAAQHELAVALSTLVPTLIFGDPMQGIFEFAGATLNWQRDIHSRFPLVRTLDTPHRWAERNRELGEWIAETRARLVRGEPIDLTDPRITYRECKDAFDMGALFGSMEGKEGGCAAIHCNKAICYRLAKAAGGGFQAIEEMAGNRLREFADAWDRPASSRARLATIASLLEDCFRKRPVSEDGEDRSEATSVEAALDAIGQRLDTGNGADFVLEFMALSRKHPGWRLFRSQLWRDAERAAVEVAAGRAESMSAATASVKRRADRSGRRLPMRTVSTPLLLKGLEFDHVVVPDATHFEREGQAQAKLFYVAISRATRSLTITSSKRQVRFPVPNG